ncbi:hypothetical protein [Nostoc sp.]
MGETCRSNKRWKEIHACKDYIASYQDLHYRYEMKIDFLSSKGTATNIFTITSGEGLFFGAVGTLTLSEVYQISLDPNIPTTGKSKVSGTIQVFSKNIPEPSTTTALAFIGMMGAAFWLPRQQNTPTSG